MTSEAIVSLFVGKLGDLISVGAESLFKMREEIEWIRRELRSLQSFLKEADDATHKENARWRNWVQEIRDIAYDAEDIIDAYIVSQADRLGFMGHVRKWIPMADELTTLHNVFEQIQKIRSRITDLSSNMQAFHFDIDGINNEGGGGSSSSRALRNYRWIHAELKEPDMVGMQGDMKTLKDRLLDGDPNRRVVSIVGMGGSGKTTLARKVYRELENEFDCHAFIYVSQHYTLREIWTRLVKSVITPKPEAGEIEKLNDKELVDKLNCYLSGKRYLLVIDDIWSTDAWDMFKYVLPNSWNESRVMLTTRKRDVAAHADPLSPPHEIRLLNGDEAWELFLRETFRGENAPIVCPEELEETGRQILAKCHGLPLAIVLLGGLLVTKDKVLSAWSRVLVNVTKCLAESSDESSDKLMKILALSYHDLPYYLKPCFLYFGLFRPFPNDEISSKRLIRLWVAEGFIQQEGTTVMSEDQAEDYLEKLIDRSMIQVAARRTNGSIKSCRIHDLLRDLAIFEAKENNFFAIQADNSTNEGLSSVRRLALYCDTEMNEAINCPAATLRLRSMLCFSDRAIDLSQLLNRSGKLLRVLEIDGDMEPRRKLCKNIGDFVNVRYLSLRGYAIKSLPSSIGNLSNLLTLELTFKGTLPNQIGYLSQLRHLYAYDYEVYDVRGHALLQKLRNLQTLCLSAGSWIEDCLRKLTNLRKLGIRGNLTGHHEALSISIDELCSLRSLKLVCANSIPQKMSFTHHSHLYKMYLEGLMEKLIELPRNLAKLTLLKSKLEQDAIATLEKLPHLKTLRLLAGSYCSENMICSLGGFLRLEFLEFDCSNLKEWIAEEGSMPSLNRVELHNKDNLRTLPEKVRDLSR